MTCSILYIVLLPSQIAIVYNYIITETSLCFVTIGRASKIIQKAHINMNAEASQLLNRGGECLWKEA